MNISSVVTKKETLKHHYLKNACPGPTTRLRKPIIAAGMNGLELTNIKLLVNDAHLKINRIRRRQINSDLINIEPKQEPLNLNALQVRNGPDTDLASDRLLIIDQVIELDVAFG